MGRSSSRLPSRQRRWLSRIASAENLRARRPPRQRRWLSRIASAENLARRSSIVRTLDARRRLGGEARGAADPPNAARRRAPRRPLPAALDAAACHPDSPWVRKGGRLTAPPPMHPAVPCTRRARIRASELSLGGYTVSLSTLCSKSLSPYSTLACTDVTNTQACRGINRQVPPGRHAARRGCGRALHAVPAVVARVQLLRLKQQRERGAAGYRAPDVHVRRGQVVEHARRLVRVRRAHRHVQHAACRERARPPERAACRRLRSAASLAHDAAFL